jgi:hypothetical protein
MHITYFCYIDNSLRINYLAFAVAVQIRSFCLPSHRWDTGGTSVVIYTVQCERDTGGDLYGTMRERAANAPYTELRVVLDSGGQVGIRPCLDFQYGT